MIYKIFICFLSGIGAGLGTGFAGMSAAAVISPMLITFLGLPAYEATPVSWRTLRFHSSSPHASECIQARSDTHKYSRYSFLPACCSRRSSGNPPDPEDTTSGRRRLPSFREP